MHTKQVLCLAASADGKWLATGSQDRTAKLWDATKGNGVRTFSGLTESAISVSFSKDNGLLAVGAWDGVVRLFNPANGQLVKQFPPAAPDAAGKK